MQTAYDEIPYPGSCYTQTHPDRLAVMATLFGLAPAPVARCRVLEIGCGDGGNLIPMAFGLPQSSFTGVDLAESAIARGQELIGRLGLHNIRLRCLDLMDIDSGFPEFDYIIAHGVYSWVPPQAAEKILDVCKSHLAAQGVAFVSYNTYPGGHLLDTIREMMQFHTRDARNPRERLRQARELLEFLLQAYPHEDAHGMLIGQQVKLLLDRRPEFFYHDELSEHNHRFYFHEFVDQARHHGLQFLSEARLLSMQTDAFGPEIAEKIRALTDGDELAREQYLDFLKLRTFRQSLLCHSEVAIDRTLRSQRVSQMFAASDARPSSPETDLLSTSPLQFQYPSGGTMSTNHPLAKAAMSHLGRVWPQALPFSELLQTARAIAQRDASGGEATLEEDSNWLSDMMVRLYAANFLELYVQAPAFVTKVSARPVASPMARAQIQEASSVTNLRHTSIEVEDEAARQLLLLLDGTRTQEQLLAELRQCVNDEITPESLDANLTRLGKLALLVA